MVDLTWCLSSLSHVHHRGKTFRIVSVIEFYPKSDGIEQTIPNVNLHPSVINALSWFLTFWAQFSFGLDKNLCVKNIGVNVPTDSKQIKWNHSLVDAAKKCQTLHSNAPVYPMISRADF